ncbi:hypothetical protein FKM82_024745 [Ascaphus truei]
MVPTEQGDSTQGNEILPTARDHINTAWSSRRSTRHYFTGRRTMQWRSTAQPSLRVKRSCPVHLGGESDYTTRSNEGK